MNCLKKKQIMTRDPALYRTGPTTYVKTSSAAHQAVSTPNTDEKPRSFIDITAAILSGRFEISEKEIKNLDVSQLMTTRKRYVDARTSNLFLHKDDILKQYIRLLDQAIDGHSGTL